MSFNDLNFLGGVSLAESGTVVFKENDLPLLEGVVPLLATGDALGLFAVELGESCSSVLPPTSSSWFAAEKLNLQH